MAHFGIDDVIFTFAGYWVHVQAFLTKIVVVFAWQVPKPLISTSVRGVKSLLSANAITASITIKVLHVGGMVSMKACKKIARDPAELSRPNSFVNSVKA